MNRDETIMNLRRQTDRVMVQSENIMSQLPRLQFGNQNSPWVQAKNLDHLVADQEYVKKLLKQYLALADSLQELDQSNILQEALMPNLEFKPTSNRQAEISVEQLTQYLCHSKDQTSVDFNQKVELFHEVAKQPEQLIKMKKRQLDDIANLTLTHELFSKKKKKHKV